MYGRRKSDMEEETHPFTYWQTISPKIKVTKDWIDENQIDGKVEAEDVKKLINQTFELEE